MARTGNRLDEQSAHRAARRNRPREWGALYMNVLLLCEGDPETRDSWSGISRSVLQELRGRGHSVTPGDVELYGLKRLIAAATTFSPSKARWRRRFRVGTIPFKARTINARKRIDATGGRTDIILQVGATFDPRGYRLPYCLLCDSNIHMSQEGANTGHSEATWLRPGELRRIAARESALYRDASAVFTLSERARQSFVQDFAVPPTLVHAVHAGPNFDLSEIPATHRTTSSPHPPTVLFVGRDFERKGGACLLAAFRLVRQQIPDASLLVVGPDPVERPDQGVRYLGFLDKDRLEDWRRLLEAYRTADVFCLPTRFEPYGIVFIEAMHFGLPCVGTSVWAVPEMVVEGETGFLVEVDDSAALADRLLRILRDPALAHRMGAAGRTRAQARFTWAVVAKQIEEKMFAVLGMEPGIS